MSGDTSKAIKRLTEAGIPSEDARFDIGILFACFGDDEKAFDEAVRKRAEGMPVAYITGRQAFYKEEYIVTTDVLIPRADSELAVEAALRFAGALDFAAGDVAEIPVREGLSQTLRILDLCTGTGCIGISAANSLAKKYPQVEVVLSDVSQKALTVCGGNIKEAAFNPNAFKTVKLDVLTREGEEDLGMFDIITANPPYVDKKDMDSIDPQVGGFEPHLALYGGQDGLEFYGPLCELSLRHLNPRGALIAEHGYNQGAEVANAFKQRGFNNVKTLKDFGGNDRICFGEAPGVR